MKSVSVRCNLKVHLEVQYYIEMHQKAACTWASKAFFYCRMGLKYFNLFL